MWADSSSKSPASRKTFACWYSHTSHNAVWDMCLCFCTRSSSSLDKISSILLSSIGDLVLFQSASIAFFFETTNYLPQKIPKISKKKFSGFILKRGCLSCLSRQYTAISTRDRQGGLTNRSNTSTILSRNSSRRSGQHPREPKLLLSTSSTCHQPH